MSRRTYLVNDRLVISLPGYDAGPFLADEYKAFDSNWDWTGTLIASGFYSDPTAPYNGNAYRTQDGSDSIIPISVPFSIREFLIHVVNGTTANGRFSVTQALNFSPYITGNQLRIPRASFGNGVYGRFGAGAIYRVFSV